MKTQNMGRPTLNKYKVPLRQWRKWTNHGRRVFNEMYEAMSPRMQFAYLHPKATPMARGHWQTTRWNAAWTAASAASRQGVSTKPEEIVTVYPKRKGRK